RAGRTTLTLVSHLAPSSRRGGQSSALLVRRRNHDATSGSTRSPSVRTVPWAGVPSPTGTPDPSRSFTAGTVAVNTGPESQRERDTPVTPRRAGPGTRRRRPRPHRGRRREAGRTGRGSARAPTARPSPPTGPTAPSG